MRVEMLVCSKTPVTVLGFWVISPFKGMRLPASSFKSVVLPLPLGPMMQTFSPGLSVILKSLMSSTEGSYEKLKSCAESAYLPMNGS